MQLLLLGDSLLAEIGSRHAAEIEQRLPGWMALNCAMGGFTAAHCRRQAEYVARILPTAVLVSLGTNDAMPEWGVSEAAFERDLGELLNAFPDALRFVLLPPGVDEARQATTGARSNAKIDRYRAVAARATEAACAQFVDGRRVAATVRELGQDPYVADGVHLSDAMYVALAEELATLLR